MWYNLDTIRGRLDYIYIIKIKEKWNNGRKF